MDAHVVDLFRARFETRDGILLWRHWPDGPKQWNTLYAGKPAGTLRHDGYLQVRFCGRFHVAHRILWTLQHGRIPDREVDHINGNRIDNRLENLRLATRSQNRRNSRARGEWPKGVYRNRYGLFVAQLKMEGKNNYLGSYSTPEEAHQVYTLAADIYFGEFACVSR